MAKTFTILLTAVTLSLCGRDAAATSISITTNQTFIRPQVGDEALVVLGISDLGTTLGAFDLSLSWDPTILVPSRITFQSALGVPDVISWQYDAGGGSPVYNPLTLGSGEAITGAIAAPGSAEVFDVSLLEDSLGTCIFCVGPFLADLQSPPFPLIAFVFDTISVGTSPLNIQINSLADGTGNGLAATAVNSSLTVYTPEPATVLLLAAGIPLAAWRARRFRIG